MNFLQNTILLRKRIKYVECCRICFNVSHLQMRQSNGYVWNPFYKAKGTSAYQKIPQSRPIWQRNVNLIMERETERVKPLQKAKPPLVIPTAAITEMQPWLAAGVRLTKYFHSLLAREGYSAILWNPITTTEIM